MYVIRGVNDLGKDSYRLLVLFQLGVGALETRKDRTAHTVSERRNASWANLDVTCE